MELTIQKSTNLKPKPDQNKLGFGIHFTDHMFNMDYAPDNGWHNPRIEPYAGGRTILDLARRRPPILS